MRTAKVLGFVLFSLVIFGLSFCAFFPFGAASELAWTRAVRGASERGFALDASSVSAPGRLPPEVMLMNVRIRSPLASGEAGRIRAEFSPADTLRHLAPAARIRLERVSVDLPVKGRQPLSIPWAEARLVFRPGGIEVLGLRTSGDLSVSGTAVFSPATMSLDEADLSIGGDRASILESFRPLLPLRQETPGTWILKKERVKDHGRD